MRRPRIKAHVFKPKRRAGAQAARAGYEINPTAPRPSYHHRIAVHAEGVGANSQVRAALRSSETAGGAETAGPGTGIETARSPLADGPAPNKRSGPKG
jgi:hypothetical protein